jgi:hypothetical protein
VKAKALLVETRPVYVLATTFEATEPAIAAAVPLARGAGSYVVVLVPKFVPYSIALDRSGDSSDFVTRRYRDLLARLGASAEVRVCVCRRVEDVLDQAIDARSTIVVGGRTGGWLPGDSLKLVRRAASHGHHVIFVPRTTPRG